MDRVLGGSNQGEKIEKIISDPHNEVLTCAAMVAEVVSKAKLFGSTP